MVNTDPAVTVSAIEVDDRDRLLSTVLVIMLSAICTVATKLRSGIIVACDCATDITVAVGALLIPSCALMTDSEILVAASCVDLLIAAAVTACATPDPTKADAGTVLVNTPVETAGVMTAAASVLVIDSADVVTDILVAAAETILRESRVAELVASTTAKPVKAVTTSRLAIDTVVAIPEPTSAAGPVVLVNMLVITAGAIEAATSCAVLDDRASEVERHTADPENLTFFRNEPAEIACTRGAARVSVSSRPIE